MKIRSLRIIAATALTLWGCPSTPPKVEKAVAHPETVVQIASLNLTDLNKRIERKHIIELAKVLKREEIDMLTVQGITRYPGVATRIDFVDELSSQTEWRSVFGEMMNTSGRQTGNAIFSSFPITSHFNQSFETVKAADFEAAIEATIDAGVLSLNVVSTRLPSRAAIRDQLQCLRMISPLLSAGKNSSVIISGNLPESDTVKNGFGYDEIPVLRQTKRAPRMWYSPGSPLQFIASRTFETELGSLIVGKFGIFRQQ